jgi:long-chain acyl-CoA synthetase
MGNITTTTQTSEGRGTSAIKHIGPYESLQAIPEIWSIAAHRFGSITALSDPHSKPAVNLTYAELYQQIQQFAAGLQALEIQPDQHIALFSDNQPRWLVADQGIMTAGAVDAVRGSQADRDELLYILEHSDSVALVVQDLATLTKLSPQFDSLRVPLVILLTDETVPVSHGFRILNFTQVMELGAGRALQPVPRDSKKLATLMYTSGTSGMPKGVQLSHQNLLSQVRSCPSVVRPAPGDRVMSILPIWHSYERSFEYFTLSLGCTQIYTNIRFVKKDLQDFHPKYMVAVPRLWESIYEGIQKQFREQPASKQRLVKSLLQVSQRYIQARRILQGLVLDHLQPSWLEKGWASLQMAALWGIHRLADKLVYTKVRAAMGGNFVFIVSGGGSIADYLEDFYEIAGINILGGYGLTETSPITHVRRPWRNLRGADGQPLPQTETRIVDPETRLPLPTGERGLVLLRGPQIMLGYYKNPDATAKAIDAEGWFDTGDLGKVTAWGDLIITGRAKDTIVLSNGENIEPQPIENACLRSPYVDQIMLVGQDQKSLGALIVPNFDALQQWATTQNLTFKRPDAGAIDAATPSSEVTLASPAIQDLFRQEISREVQNRPGYRADERIGPIQLLSEPFSIENGFLTQKLSLRRNVVMERYQGMIDKMFS